MNEPGRQPRGAVSPAIALTLVSIPIFLGALDLTVISAVLPHVILELELPLQQGLDDAAWMVTGYLLAYSISMTFMGRLSDLNGRRRVFLIALVIFALGSYLVASAQTWPLDLALQAYYRLVPGRPDVAYVTLYVLIGARMIQAFGAGAMVPVGMAVVGDLYPVTRRAAPLGLIAAVDTAGWVFGHLYGGVIVRFWPWTMIFWLNLPICLVAFLLIWFLLRRLPQERKPGRMDWVGVALLTATLTTLNLGLGREPGASFGGSTMGTPGLSPEVGPILATSALLLLAFIWQQLRARFPLIDLALFRRPNYLLACCLNLLVGACLFITIANVPLFINSLVASTAEEGAWVSGWLLCALTVPMSLASVPGGWICQRFSYRLPTAVGLLVAALGFLTMRSWLSATPYSTLASNLALTGIGIGLTMAPVAAAVLNVSPLAEMGTSSALVIVFRLIGMMIGISGATQFGLWRAEHLGRLWLPAGADLAQVYAVGIRTMETVISETFLMAAGVAGLAILGSLFLKAQVSQITHGGN